MCDLPIINEIFRCSDQTWVHQLPMTVEQGFDFDSSVGTFPDIVSGLVSPTESDLVIASLNINTISIDKFNYVLDRMIFHNVDILVFKIQDT
jgi:hypothetical protein